MAKAVVVENLSKRFMLGETFAGTLRERLARTLTRSAAHPTQEEFWALRDVGFEVEQGEAIGIIGGNGAGKSTLLKILSRITPPTKGRALVRGRLSSLLEVGTGFHPELTGRENVFLNGAILGMRKQEIARKFDEIVDFSGVSKFIDTPVKRYSSGMYVRLAFAVAAHLESDVLLIDEVLAVGDAEFQRRCLGKMNDVVSVGRTVFFVSHNMAAVQAITSRSIVLKAGSVYYDGATPDAIAKHLGQTEVGAKVYDLKEIPRIHSHLSGEATLLRAEMEAVSHTKAGYQLDFEITVSASVILKRVRLGISLFRSDQLTIGAMFTPAFDIGAVTEPLAVKVRTPVLPLGEGKFSLAISIVSGHSAVGMRAHDAVINILHFEVVGGRAEEEAVIGWANDWGGCNFGLAQIC